MTPYTILLIEDDDALRQVLTRRLERLGYEVIACANGNDAIRVGDERVGPIDLVLSDMVMPGIGPEEVAARLAEKRPAVPIVFMSGYMRDDAMGAALLGPNRHFIEKPFETEALKAALERALEL